MALAGLTTLANSESGPERGLTAGRSYSVSDVETIALQSGNLMFNIPVGSLPAGRGGLSAGMTLLYNSKLWDVLATEVEDSHNNLWEAHELLKSPEGGWQYGYKYYFTTEQGELNTTRWMLVTPDHARHLMLIGNGNNAEGNYTGDQSFNFAGSTGQTVRLLSTDNTFMRVEFVTDGSNNPIDGAWTLYLPDGSRVVNKPASGVDQRLYDRNGNFIDIIETAADSNFSGRRTTCLKDNLDRKVVIEYDTGSGGIDQDTIHSPGLAGVDLQTRVIWKSLQVNHTYHLAEGTAPMAPPGHWQNYPLNTTVRVVDEVHQPTVSAFDPYFKFSYNADTTTAADSGFGEVNSVRLPSGATTAYDYHLDSAISPFAERVAWNGVATKTLSYDLEYDGASPLPTSEVWHYSRTGTGSNDDPVTSASVTGPDGGVTSEYYKDRAVAGVDIKGETVKIVHPDGSVVERWYESDAPGGGASGPNPFVTANRYVKYEFASIADASGSPTKTLTKAFTRDKNGNVTEVKEYDFAPYSGTGSVHRNAGGEADGPATTGAGATVLRKTVTTYHNDTPEASDADYTDGDVYTKTGARLSNLVKSVEVQTGGGTPKSRSEMGYDYTSYSSNTKGGNLTQTKTWDSTVAAYSNPLSSNFVTTSAAYDSYGNPTLTTDARGVETAITYGSVGGYGGLYPTQVETASNYSALKRTATTTYDFHTGLAVTSTDADNGVTSKTEYDDLGRPTKAIAAYGDATWESWTTTDYHDADRFVVVRSDLETKGDGKKVAAQYYDQLGRVRLSRTLEDAAAQNPDDPCLTTSTPCAGVKVQTRYLSAYSSPNGYTYQLTSNPYRASASSSETADTMGWTRSKGWKDGKRQEVETFSGSSLPAPWGTNATSTGKVVTETDATATTVTDQAGKLRRSITNALGQLVRVDEPDGSSGSGSLGTVASPNQATTYAYDTLNNLTTVTQGAQTRSFTYSSLSRLLTAANPESGTISYVYDNNGNLTEKTDARGVVTDYVYDALNRVTNRNYSTPSGAPSNYQATPNVTYTYDNLTNAKGKLTKVSSSVSTTEYTAFDILGRVTASKQTTDGVTYGNGTTDSLMTYAYNLSGAMIEQQYPSGRKVRNTLDASGDLEMVASRKNANSGYWAYSDNFTYNAAGAVTAMQLGNGTWESTAFNSRLQPTQIALGTTNTGATAYDKLKLDYTYGTTANNGNVLSQTITVAGTGGFTAVQNYTYDSLNRIKDADEKPDGWTATNCASDPTKCWKQTFTYDRYGNRNFDEANTTTLPRNCGSSPNLTVCTADKKVFNPAVNTSNNRLSTGDNYAFDTSGNTTGDAQGRTFIYDAENKQVEVKNSSNATIGQYWYDGDGKRVKKHVPGTGETTIFVYDAAGKLVAEYSTIVASTNDAQVAYLTNDHLGSPRINTDKNGNVTARHDYHPFGEEVATGQRSSGLGYTGDTVRNQFTGYDRDEEILLDFAQARYYDFRSGRFSGPDPYNVILEKDRVTDKNEREAIFLAILLVPSSWNRYAYGLNQPLLYTDPTGRIYLKSGDNYYYINDETYSQMTKKQVEGLIGGSFKVIPSGSIISIGDKTSGIFAGHENRKVVLGDNGNLLDISDEDIRLGTVQMEHDPSTAELVSGESDITTSWFGYGRPTAEAYAEQAIRFPNGDRYGSADPYGGGFRHCTATCLLTRRSRTNGLIGRRIWDFINENEARDPWTWRTDRQAEDIGTFLRFNRGRCSVLCSNAYP